MATRIPSEVPVFDEAMIFKGLHGPEGRQCAVRWLLTLFGCERTGRVPYCDLLVVVVNRNSARRYENAPAWNDDPNVSEADIATCLNRATAIAGYVVGNPEARWVAAQKRSKTLWRPYREALSRERNMSGKP